MEKIRITSLRSRKKLQRKKKVTDKIDAEFYSKNEGIGKRILNYNKKNTRQIRPKSKSL